jgi:hypothetical protein
MISRWVTKTILLDACLAKHWQRNEAPLAIGERILPGLIIITKIHMIYGFGLNFGDLGIGKIYLNLSVKSVSHLTMFFSHNKSANSTFSHGRDM